MIQRIPTQSPALIRFIRSDAVQEQIEEMKMLATIGAMAYAIVGLLEVIKRAVSLLIV